jgi:hypothetical protein
VAKPVIAVVFTLIAAAMWLRFLVFPGALGGAEGDVDLSWNQAYAYFLKNHAQAGKDYVFTYGPLGYFQTDLYDADLFWHKVAWELVLRGVFVAAIMRFITHLRGLPAKLGFALLALAFVPMGEYFFPLLLISVIVLKEDWTSVPWLAAVALFFAIISLVKFTYFMYLVPVVCLMSLGMAGNQRGWAALWPLGLFAGALCLVWLSLGQSLANLPGYLVGSWQISAGYAAGMGSEGDPTELCFAGLITVTFAAALFPLAGRDLPAARRLGSLRQLCLLGLLGLTIFMEWKHGFIQHGGICVVFFSLFLLVPFLLPWLFADYDWTAAPRVRLLTACFSLSLAAITVFGSGIDWIAFFPSLVNSVVANARVVVSPSRLSEELDRRQAQKAEAVQLPMIRARVSSAPVDVISVEQGVLLLNRMNWTPRPVFQSYSAYTPFLQRANADFFRSGSAPDFVVFRVEPLSPRFPTLEEGQSLLELLRRYRPVLSEKGYLLLERDREASGSARPEGQVVLEKAVQFGEWVDLTGLPGKYHTLALKITPSGWGRVQNFLYKPPAVSIQVGTGPGVEPVPYRLVPGMAEDGFLLNPLVGSVEDVVNLYDRAHAPAKTVTGFCVSTGGSASYQDEIAVTIKSYPSLIGSGIDPAILMQIQYPVMRTPFVRATAHEPVTVETYDGKDVLRIHAPSAVQFDVPANSVPRRITGKFGILPEAYRKSNDHTDGVQFAVEYTPAGKAALVLFERFLDPHANARDRGFQEFAVVLPPGDKGTVVLKAFNPPGRNQHLDWSFWTDVEIEGMPSAAITQPKVDDGEAEYRQMIRQVRATAAKIVPPGATVLVVSKGDDDLLQLPGRTGLHFPQKKDRSYLGYTPDEDEAIANLEAARANGAQFLLFPQTAFWWLEDYQKFRRHLEGRYQRLGGGDSCVIYRLSGPAPEPRAQTPAGEADAGVLEGVDRNGISGWAWDKSAPNKAVKVDIYDGEKLLATVVADVPREDLAAAGKGDGRHGFSCASPAALTDGKPHVVHARINGTGIELSGSPKTLKNPGAGSP